jgi:hypothetical protein
MQLPALTATLAISSPTVSVYQPILTAKHTMNSQELVFLATLVTISVELSASSPIQSVPITRLVVSA